MADVEDIMCDQCILTSEFNVQFNNETPYLVVPTSKLWLAIDVLARVLLPPVSTFYYAILRNPPQTVLSNVRHQILPTLVAFLANNVSKSLASVQKMSLPMTLRIAKDEDGRSRAFIDDGGEECGRGQAAILDSGGEDVAERCVECVVLSQPEGDVLVDVIFIHGLHGGIDRTWKQGTWRTQSHKLINQSPVRRPSTGDLFVPPTDRSLKRTLSGMYSKIPKKIARKHRNFDNLREKNLETEENTANSEEYSECWPRDWIPKDCPNARVIAVNYSTDVLWCPTWLKKRKRTGLVARSQEMLQELVKINVGKRPIVWVGHSKGGLFIKQIMINAWENNEDNFKDIFRQSKGIMWYSVPHRGSTLADCAFPLLRRSIEVLEVQKNCDFVLDLHKKFLDVIEKEDLQIDIFSFIETAFTLMSFIYIKIVAYDSADPNIGIKCDVPLDHREICKPAGRDCFLYSELIKIVNKNVSIIGIDQ
ncbi:unnamed protein product [Phaedon cochleariae]|uniref:Protein SERAC1 n=1 Tax=Phaedon cochleariae TaxID=80249 RepID=A0A9P0DW32_PHACE|nr:unnamed protein product [Phaedon cochleariae]